MKGNMTTRTPMLGGFITLALALPAVGTAGERPPDSWLEAARRAGGAVSATVFDETGNDSETGVAQVEATSRISGKAIVVATVIASAAVVTAAWLLRGNRCEPGLVHTGLGDWWRDDLLDWSRELGGVLRRGPGTDGVPPPLPPLAPPPPLPGLEVCVPG